VPYRNPPLVSSVIVGSRINPGSVIPPWQQLADRCDAHGQR
jgi:hypothetical protein